MKDAGPPPPRPYFRTIPAPFIPKPCMAVNFEDAKKHFLAASRIHAAHTLDAEPGRALSPKATRAACLAAIEGLDRGAILAALRRPMRGLFFLRYRFAGFRCAAGFFGRCIRRAPIETTLT